MLLREVICHVDAHVELMPREGTMAETSSTEQRISNVLLSERLLPDYRRGNVRFTLVISILCLVLQHFQALLRSPRASSGFDDLSLMHHLYIQNLKVFQDRGAYLTCLYRD